MLATASDDCSAQVVDFRTSKFLYYASTSDKSKFFYCFKSEFWINISSCFLCMLHLREFDETLLTNNGRKIIEESNKQDGIKLTISVVD